GLIVHADRLCQITPGNAALGPENSNAIIQRKHRTVSYSIRCVAFTQRHGAMSSARRNVSLPPKTIADLESGFEAWRTRAQGLLAAYYVKYTLHDVMIMRHDVLLS